MFIVHIFNKNQRQQDLSIGVDESYQRGKKEVSNIKQATNEGKTPNRVYLIDLFYTLRIKEK